MPKALDIQGRRFGRLLVVSRVQVEKARNVMWFCKCDCGQTTVAAAANIGKSTLSCGCLATETATALLQGNTYTRTHNLSLSSEYKTWGKMHQRCHNPNNPKFPRYGGRGIKICERWKEFLNFYEDMGPRPSRKHSIERENNDGDYEPTNCVWATNVVQSRNKSQNKLVTINGITLCVIEWCEALQIPRWKPYEMLRGRGRDRNLPPQFTTIDKALEHLYHLKSSAALQAAQGPSTTTPDR